MDNKERPQEETIAGYTVEELAKLWQKGYAEYLSDALAYHNYPSDVTLVEGQTWNWMRTEFGAFGFDAKIEAQVAELVAAARRNRMEETVMEYRAALRRCNNRIQGFKSQLSAAEKELTALTLQAAEMTVPKGTRVDRCEALYAGSHSERECDEVLIVAVPSGSEEKEWSVSYGSESTSEAVARVLPRGSYVFDDADLDWSPL